MKPLDSPSSQLPKAFWKKIPLSQMTMAMWEALCDRCGKCCLHKLEDADTGTLYYTNVACRLLDLRRCHCRRYDERTRLVPQCATVTPELLTDPYWLPTTCAYRLLAEGKPLPKWHPLRHGSSDKLRAEGHRVCDWAIPETAAGDLLDHIIPDAMISPP